MKGSIFLVLLLMFSGSIFAQEDSFFSDDDFFDEDEGSSSLIEMSYGGSAGADLRINDDFVNENEYLDLDIEFTSSYIDLSINADFKLEGFDDIGDFPLQNSKYLTSFYVDTAFLRFYHSLFDLEIGLLKPIWGNADGVHAVDVLNPLDYSDPFGTSYLNSKISQQMVKLNIPLGDALLEIAYLPTFNGDYIPLAGMWTPYYVSNMEETIYNMAYTVGLATAIAANPNVPEENLIPGVKTDSAAAATAIAATLGFEDSEYFTSSQAAARFTTSINSFDFGLTYYYGFLKQPTIDPAAVLATYELTLIYNRVQTIGFDVAAALGSLNLKGEIGYNLTEDIDGDDASINNNSLKYIVGFDMNLPINNVNFLIQGVGNTILNSSEVTIMDPQYSADDEYTSISVMGRLSDNYLNESLYVEVAGAYYLFDNDFMVKPKVTYNFGDNTKFYVEYLLLEGDETTTFGQYTNNDTLKIGLDFQF